MNPSDKKNSSARSKQKIVPCEFKKKTCPTPQIKRLSAVRVSQLSVTYMSYSSPANSVTWLITSELIYLRDLG